MFQAASVDSNTREEFEVGKLQSGQKKEGCTGEEKEGARSQETGGREGYGGQSRGKRKKLRGNRLKMDDLSWWAAVRGEASPFFNCFSVEENKKSTSSSTNLGPRM